MQKAEEGSKGGDLAPARGALEATLVEVGQTPLEMSPLDLADCYTLVYTPIVATTPRRLNEDLCSLVLTFNELVRSARQTAELPPSPQRSVVELLIVDEVDRLKMPELEEIRDRYDRANFADGTGVVLIGLPGIEKRLARYPQLYSRLVQRLFAQIERVLEINRLRTITTEVVETARENLVIGPLL